MVVGAAFTIKNETRYNMGRIRFYIYINMLWDMVDRILEVGGA